MKKTITGRKFLEGCTTFAAGALAAGGWGSASCSGPAGQAGAGTVTENTPGYLGPWPGLLTCFMASARRPRLSKTASCFLAGIRSKTLVMKS
jgi:hypothetical protein